MFRDNQFEVSPVFRGEGRAEIVNPPFSYPKRVVRVANTAALDTGFPGPSVLTVPLRAGYMRNLWTGYNTGGDLPDTRLRFQFNPQTIEQEVVARQDMYLSVLQDPAQLSQPVAGNTNFRFDLLFDRTMEVMNGGTRKATLDDPPGVTPSETGPGDSSDIGVLADLQVMYAIIGQGMNSRTISEQAGRIKQIANREYIRAVQSQDPYFNKNNAYDLKSVDGSKPYEAKDFTDLYSKAFNSFTSNANIGNAAFLVPMPVRILFSSLNMVDGYVVKSSVQFTKFNTNMVPIQCRVMLEVNAVYIGFARDKTFVTNQIEASITEERKLKESSKEEANNFIKNIATKYLKTLNVVFSSNAYYANSAAAKMVMADQSFLDTFHQNPKAVGFGAKGDWWFGTTVDGDIPAYSAAFSSPDDPKNEQVFKFYKETGSITIGLSLKINVYGPFDSESAAKSGAGQNIGYYSYNKWCNAAEEWKFGIFLSPLLFNNSINVSSNAITRERGYDLGIGPDPATETIRAIDDLYDAWGSKWFKFVVRATVDIKGTADSTATGLTYASNATKTAEQTFYVQGSTNIGNKVISLNFDWSNVSSGAITFTPGQFASLSTIGSGV